MANSKPQSMETVNSRSECIPVANRRTLNRCHTIVTLFSWHSASVFGELVSVVEKSLHFKTTILFDSHTVYYYILLWLVMLPSATLFFIVG